MRRVYLFSLQISKRILAEDAGQDLIEYGLVAALVGLGAIASMKGLATSIGTVFSSVGTTLTSAV